MNSIRHTRPGFIEGAVVALIASSAITLTAAVFDWVLPSGLLSHVLINITGFAYLLYLLSRSREKVGRITAIFMYIAMTLAGWLFMPSLPWVLVAHIALIWLIRSLYFYSSLLSALLDLVLTGVSLVGAIAAYLHTDSVFLALWSLFLIQALFSWIPADWKGRKAKTSSAVLTDRFEVAHRAAENALRKLASQSPSNSFN